MNNPYTGEEIRVYTNDEIDIRDTYVLPREGKYYLYGTQGFEAFKGTAIAYNDEGNIRGPFVQENELITPPNMGHVNLFETFDGQLMMATHYPDDDENELGCSTPIFFKVIYDEKRDTIRVDDAEFLKAHPEP